MLTAGLLASLNAALLTLASPFKLTNLSPQGLTPSSASFPHDRLDRWTEAARWPGLCELEPAPEAVYLTKRGYAIGESPHCLQHQTVPLPSFPFPEEQ